MIASSKLVVYCNEDFFNQKEGLYTFDGALDIEWELKMVNNKWALFINDHDEGGEGFENLLMFMGVYHFEWYPYVAH